MVTYHTDGQIKRQTKGGWRERECMCMYAVPCLINHDDGEKASL
jgi:hypothetical protein